MRDPLETVAVTIGGGSFAGWEDVSITYAADQAARTAKLTVSDFAGAVPFRPGEPCTITASGTLILTGYVRTVTMQLDSSDHSVELEIVSRAVDAVEASVDHPTGFLRDKKLDDIAREFDSCGVGIECDESFPVEPRTYLQTGQSLFDTLAPLARAHDALIYDTPAGHLRIAKKPRGRHAGRIAHGEGGNIISGSATVSEDQRFSPVLVRGQSTRGQTALALRPEGRAIDDQVRRRRPLIQILESEATSGKLKTRAERHIKRAAGYSRQANLTLVGWRDSGGRIWEQHFLVAVIAPRLSIEQDMAINSVTLSQSMDGGTTASLALVDPRALNGSGAGGKSADVWATPAGAGSVGWGA